ncbi:MAG: hypothetical protein SFX18_01115 [Pirellulales bacterium]|nr:hypothetical protein [Pirellulales bacterium]
MSPTKRLLTRRLLSRMITGWGMSCTIFMAAAGVFAGGPGMPYHREPGCIDGICVPKRETNGFHETRWRPWPGTEQGPPPKPRYEGVNAPKSELPPPKTELDLPAAEPPGGAAASPTQPNGVNPATPVVPGNPFPDAELSPELRGTVPATPPVERLPPMGQLPRNKPSRRLPQLATLPDHSPPPVLKLPQTELTPSARVVPPASPRSTKMPLARTNVGTPRSGSPSQTARNLLAELQNPASAGLPPALRPEDAPLSGNPRLSLDQALRIQEVPSRGGPRLAGHVSVPDAGPKLPPVAKEKPQQPTTPSTGPLASADFVSQHAVAAIPSPVRNQEQPRAGSVEKIRPAGTPPINTSSQTVRITEAASGVSSVPPSGQPTTSLRIKPQSESPTSDGLVNPASFSELATPPRSEQNRASGSTLDPHVQPAQNLVPESSAANAAQPLPPRSGSSPLRGKSHGNPLR